MPQFVLISNSCSDIACRVFHDYIKHYGVNEISYVLHYCKLLKLVLQISQGSVVTHLKQGGKTTYMSALLTFAACFVRLLLAKSY